MANKIKPLSTEETTYKPYPSFERAEENIKYRTLSVFGESSKQKKSTKKISKKKAEDLNNKNALKKGVSEKEKEDLIKLAQEAKAEEKVEDGSYGRSPTSARKRLIDKFISIYRRDIKLSEKQLRYTMNFLYWHPEEVNSKYIKFLIPATVETLGYLEAIKMTNELADALEDTKYEKPLKDYGKWLKEKSIVAKITELKKMGMNNTQIGEKLNMSSAQVVVLNDSQKKFIFPDDGSR